MTRKVGVGDVLVHSGMPPQGNPYRGNDHGYFTADDPVTALFGPQRAKALADFRDGCIGGLTAGVTFWHAPASGGARHITSPDDVNWQTMT